MDKGSGFKSRRPEKLKDILTSQTDLFNLVGGEL